MSREAEELWSCSLGREVLRDTEAARDCRGQGDGVGWGGPWPQGLAIPESRVCSVSEWKLGISSQAGALSWGGIYGN